VKQHGIHPTHKRPVYSEFVSSIEAMEPVSFPSAYTVLLIVGDARDIPVDRIARVAERFLSSGLIYVCVWGPDCERVHDIFDEVHVGDGTTEPGFTLMSTWHSDESLEEAIRFFLQWAFTLDRKIEMTSYLAITVGNSEWASTVESALSDIPAFLSHMRDDELESTGNA
jgi:hypothetical protein